MENKRQGMLRKYLVTGCCLLLFSGNSQADITSTPWSIPTPGELRAVCQDTADQLDLGFKVKTPLPDSLYQFERWQLPVHNLLSYSYFMAEVAIAETWREAASYCQLTLNVALDSSRQQPATRDWLASSVSEQCTGCSPLERRQTAALRKAFQIGLDTDPQAELEQINRYRQRFLETLEQRQPVLLLPLADCHHGLAGSQLVGEAKSIDYFPVDLNQPKQLFNFMRHARNSECRATVYKAYANRGSRNNQTNLYRMLYYRHQLAIQAGYTNWARKQLSQGSLDLKQAKQFLYLLSRSIPDNVDAPWDRWHNKTVRPAPSTLPPLELWQEYLFQLQQLSSLHFEPLAVDAAQQLFQRYQVFFKQRFLGELWVDLLRREGKVGGKPHHRSVRLASAGDNQGQYPISAVIASFSQKPPSQRQQQALLRAIGDALEGLLIQPGFIEQGEQALPPDLHGLLGEILSARLLPRPLQIRRSELLSAGMGISYHNGFLSFEQMQAINQRNAQLLGASFYPPDLYPQFSAKQLATAESYGYAPLWRRVIAAALRAPPASSNKHSRSENEQPLSLDPILQAFSEQSDGRATLLSALKIDTRSLAWVVPLTKPTVTSQQQATLSQASSTRSGSLASPSP